MSQWFYIVKKELQQLMQEIQPFRYGRLLGVGIYLLSFVFLTTSAYYISGMEVSSYFVKASYLLAGLLLHIISKVILWILTRKLRSLKSKLIVGLVHILDGVLITIACFLLLSFAVQADFENHLFFYLSVFILTLGSMFYGEYSKRSERWLMYYITFVSFPLHLIFSLIKERYRLFAMVLCVSSTILLTMILLAFQAGDILSLINPFPSMNIYYPVMVCFMVLSDRLVTYLIPKTTFAHYFNDKKQLAKIFMTWGMIVAMASLYMFDWKILMKGSEGWSDSYRNVILWSFTTYRLMIAMMEDKWNLISKTRD